MLLKSIRNLSFPEEATKQKFKKNKIKGRFACVDFLL